MKLTVYCDKDLVLRYSPDGWPKEPKKVTEFEIYAGMVYCGGDFGYEKARKKYTAALKKAKNESIPFEDQRDIATRIAKTNVLQLNNFKVPDTFYGLDLDGDVELWVPAHPDCDGGKNCIKNCHSICEKIDNPKMVARIIPTELSAQSECTLSNFYDWYREANAATRQDVLNELKRRLEIE